MIYSKSPSERNPTDKHYIAGNHIKFTIKTDKTLEGYTLNHSKLHSYTRLGVSPKRIRTSHHRILRSSRKNTVNSRESVNSVHSVTHCRKELPETFPNKSFITNTTYRPVNSKKIDSLHLKILNGMQNHWIKKRGSLGKTNEISMQAETLYRLMSSAKHGDLDGKYVIESFIQLGMSPDYEFIENVLSSHMATKNVLESKIPLSLFKRIFRTNQRSQIIRKRLNFYSHNCRKLQEKHENANKQFNDINSPYSRFKQALAAKLLNKQSKTGKTLENAALNEHYDLIVKWWSDLNKANSQVVPVSEVLSKLESLHMCDRSDSANYIYSVLGSKQLINFNEFTLLFAKSILQEALANVYGRLVQYPRELSPSVKLSSYKRSLLLSGVDYPKSDYSFEEGSRILQGLESLQAHTSQKLPTPTFEEIKGSILELSGKNEAEGLRIRYQVKDAIEIATRIAKTTNFIFKIVNGTAEQLVTVQEEPTQQTKTPLINLPKAAEEPPKETTEIRLKTETQQGHQELPHHPIAGTATSN